MRVLFRLLTILTDKIVLAQPSAAADFEGVPAKQVLVQNCVSMAYAQCISQSLGKGGGKTGMRIIHLGLMSRTRGWPELLASLSNASEEMEIVFVGEINDGSESAFSKVPELGLSERISLEPWLPFRDAFQRVAESDVGIIAFQPGRHNNVHALPHKMFDYMIAGLPVVAPAFAVEVSGIVREADCGLRGRILPTSDRSAEALEFLARRPDERRRLGDNGRQAVLTRYNWEREAAKLEAMYLKCRPDPPGAE